MRRTTAIAFQTNILALQRDGVRQVGGAAAAMRLQTQSRQLVDAVAVFKLASTH